MSSGQGWPGAARTLVALLGVLAGGVCRAQDGLIPPGRPPEWGVAAGYGVAIESPSRPSNERQVALLASVGFRLGSRFEYLAEAGGFRYLDPAGYYVGLLPLGARYRIGHGGLQPYASAGIGFGWTDLVELVEISRRFNFQIQAGLGIRGHVSETSGWTAEARWSHISNAGTSYPNRGLNAALFLGGWRFR